MNATDFEEILPSLQKEARMEALRLIRLGWFPSHDQEDLEDEFLLHAWRRREGVQLNDPRHHPYLGAIIRNRGKDLVRHEYCASRDRRLLCPLNESFEPGEGLPPHPPSMLVTPIEVGDIDVRRAIETLPPEQQRFAWSLTERSVAAAAQKAGISTSTAWRWIKQIRVLFEDRGLRRYVRSGKGPEARG